jgi:hypothetical protein
MRPDLTKVFNAKLFLAAAAIVAVAAFAAGTSRQPAAESQQQSEGTTEAEVITIRPTGFEPTEITRPRGEFRLIVQNLSGLDEADLRLSVDGGQVLYEARVPLTNRDWHRTVNPPPGTYLITEAKHPGWSCRVTITSEK